MSEVVALAPRDVSRDGVIHLYNAKGGDGTAYFDPDSVLPMLDIWLRARERWLNGPHMTVQRSRLPVSPPLFIMPGGRPMNTRYLQRLVKRLKEQLGIRGICTPHVLRHSYATELLEEGLSLVEVQTALRHAHLATTAIYLHVRDEALRRKIAQRTRRKEV